MRKQLVLNIFLAFHTFDSVSSEFDGGRVDTVRSYRSAIIAGCSTSLAFCSSVVGRSIEPLTTYLSSVTDRNDRVKTVYNIYQTLTASVLTATLTSTLAESTISIAQCVPTTTCGAAEFHSPDHLTQACKSIIRSTETRQVRTVTAPSSTRTVDPFLVIRTTTPLTFVITTTRVPTATTRTCATAPPPAQCSNVGFEKAIFDLTKDDEKNLLDPWNFDSYKTAEPGYNETKNRGIGPITSSYKDVVDYEYDECRRSFYNYRTYLFAPQTGYYIFNVLKVRLAAYAWIGEVAYAAYNQTNAFLHPGSGSQQWNYSATIHLKRGKYYPMRVGVSCTGPSDVSVFYMNIIQPDGKILEGQYTPRPGGGYSPYGEENEGIINRKTDYFVRYGCGMEYKIAPLFPPWGREVVSEVGKEPPPSNNSPGHSSDGTDEDQQNQSSRFAGEAVGSLGWILAVLVILSNLLL